MSTTANTVITRFADNFGNIIKNTLKSVGGSSIELVGQPGDEFIGISVYPADNVGIEDVKPALEALRGYLPDEFEGLHVFVEDPNENDGSEGEA